MIPANDEVPSESKKGGFYKMPVRMYIGIRICSFFFQDDIIRSLSYYVGRYLPIYQ